MTNRITFDHLRSVADTDYAATEVELPDGFIAVLHNPMRLGKGERNKLRAALGKFRSDDEDGEDGANGPDVLELGAEVITLASLGSATGKVLIDLIAEDEGLMMTVITTYLKGAQVGEASPSES